ncbi:hypothetical protein TRFO_27049 [Tritrichomonas foetus]|uniref:Uncharacterized protein n=1 Tax=Tritrichomonas foetus TaxID=1144522 RepID=A0A1J4K737_9EUKA|nr:hypothetical protein TRFO_27049 [Tritrichomonas foetus]|eukprot:OHT05245.1 hypothetical protein TRFO_27049 [Tritrichomonas foetus]
MIPRSNSNADLDKVASHFTNYSNDFMNQRNSRTLSMRRNNRPTIASFKKSENRTTGLGNIFQEPQKMELTHFIRIFNSGNENEILELNEQLIKIAETSKIQLEDILKSTEAAESYGMALSLAESDNFASHLINSSMKLFPLFSAEAKDAFIDSGIAIKLYDILLSITDDIADSIGNDRLMFLNLVFQFIAVTSKHWSYARNSFLCYSIHENLINMAFMPPFSNHVGILENICFALNAIFTNEEPVDIEKITPIVQQFAQMLSIPSPTAVSAILSALAAIANKRSSIVINYFQYNIDQMAIHILINSQQSDPDQTQVNSNHFYSQYLTDLTGSALDLLGNMCVADISLTQRMVEAGLFKILVDLIPTEYSSTALWVMSNIFESIPTRLLPFINKEFIEYLLDVGNSSSHDVKKEVAYFLATVILFVNSSIAPKFAVPDVIDMLVEMLGCGNANVVIRCMKALNSITVALLTFQGPDSVNQVFGSCDLYRQIEQVSEEYPGMISEYATALSRRIFRDM